MTRHVYEVMEELREDHRNLTVLLNLLDREIARLERVEAPDFELLHDIMTYMTGYPDAVHHKKEDWVYARMAAVRDSMQADLERIEGDHAEISAFGNKLLSDIQEIEAGAFLPRADVVADAHRYLTRQRDHMRWEDTYMFPLIDSMKAELDLSERSSRIADMADPVFGPEVLASFGSLLAAIRNEAEQAAS